jgi:hypothetical protein
MHTCTVFLHHGLAGLDHQGVSENHFLAFQSQPCPFVASLPFPTLHRVSEPIFSFLQYM